MSSARIASLQKHMQSSITETPACMGQGSQAFPQFSIRRSPKTIPDGRPRTAEYPARQPFAHLECRTQVSDSLSLGGGRSAYRAAGGQAHTASISRPNGWGRSSLRAVAHQTTSGSSWFDIENASNVNALLDPNWSFCREQRLSECTGESSSASALQQS
jgi:hypothetical protein